MTIPAQTQRGSTSAPAAPTTAYITYSPSSSTIANQNIQLVKSTNGNYLITTPTAAAPVIRNARTSQPSPIPASAIRDSDGVSVQELQKQEQFLRVREARLRCEVQEIEKEKAREELLQMREIHRMKIKEMETRLRNMERSWYDTPKFMP